MVSFIDEHRGAHGVEPICAALPIAPSTYYEHRARTIDPNKRPDRAKRDDELKVDIKRVWEENHEVYGAEKVWRQLRREKANADAIVCLGYAHILGVKGNQAEFLAEAKALLKPKTQRCPPEAETPWERRNSLTIRRRLWRTKDVTGFENSVGRWRYRRQV